MPVNDFGNTLFEISWLAADHAKLEEAVSVERGMREEGLMDGERLSATHAFELEARPAAERTVARLMEIAQTHIVKEWGMPDKTAGGAYANFGQGWWASFAAAPKGSGS